MLNLISNVISSKHNFFSAKRTGGTSEVPEEIEGHRNRERQHTENGMRDSG